MFGYYFFNVVVFGKDLDGMRMFEKDGLYGFYIVQVVFVVYKGDVVGQGWVVYKDECWLFYGFQGFGELFYLFCWYFISGGIQKKYCVVSVFLVEVQFFVFE